MSRNIQARVLIKLLDGDTIKERLLRDRLVSMNMVRRNESGDVIAHNIFKKDKGKPPRQAKP